MNFTTTTQHLSVSTPGVKFAVRRMTEGMRQALRIRLAGAFARLRSLDADRQDLIEEAAARLRQDWDKVLVADLTPAERRRLQELVEQEALIRVTEINPAYLDAGFAMLEGLTIDDAPAATAADLARGPSGLYREVLTAVLSASGLAEDARPNSASPSTSGAVEGGATPGTAAPDASAPTNTASTTASAA